MNKKSNILIGYSSRLFCDGLESVIRDSGLYSIIDLVPVWQPLTNTLNNLDNVDIVIIELCKPRKHDIDHIHTLLSSSKHINLLLISHIPHNKISAELIESGVKAFILKSCSRQDLLMALDKLSKNLNYYCSDITSSILNSNNKEHKDNDIHLTDREKEILKELVKGSNNLHISKKLSVSENTIKVHRRNIQSKFGVNNILGMVRYACRANLVDFGRDEYCMECPHCMPS